MSDLACFTQLLKNAYDVTSNMYKIVQYRFYRDEKGVWLIEMKLKFVEVIKFLLNICIFYIINFDTMNALFILGTETRVIYWTICYLVWSNMRTIWNHLSRSARPTSWNKRRRRRTFYIWCYRSKLNLSYTYKEILMK
jgi:hypothetical protein